MTEEITQEKSERTWRNDVQLDTNQMMRNMVDQFNHMYGLSLGRMPLTEFHSAVQEHYILALLQIFAHLFTGLAGCDIETEEKFMDDMAHYFKSARMEGLKVKDRNSLQ